jgi:hypothetical protein
MTAAVVEWKPVPDKPQFALHRVLWSGGVMTYLIIVLAASTVIIIVAAVLFVWPPAG